MTSVDDMGRAAAIAARRAAAALDPELMLRRLHHRRRRQQVGSSIAAAAVLTVLVIGVVEVARPEAAPPASRPTATPTVSASTDDRCNDVTIVCVGADQLRISLTAPVTVHVPGNFEDIVRLGDTSFESYRVDARNTGVTVLERAMPVRNDASWSRDSSAGTTAAAMATWLAKRPFLTNARVTPTAVDGRPAWRVTGLLRRGAPLRAVKLQEGAVAPTFAGPGTSMGYNRALLGDYTLLDVPGAGVTVVWSWTLTGAQAALAGNRSFIAALRW